MQNKGEIFLRDMCCTIFSAIVSASGYIMYEPKDILRYVLCFMGIVIFIATKPFKSRERVGTMKIVTINNKNGHNEQYAKVVFNEKYKNEPMFMKRLDEMIFKVEYLKEIEGDE
jgi:hypothetical protein